MFLYYQRLYRWIRKKLDGKPVPKYLSGVGK